MSKFDPLQVKAKADEIVRANKMKVEDARLLFLEEIMDWSDYYTEACSEQPSAPESTSTFDSIINLWIQFSLFEISLHQFKKAVEVFEKAIIDPIGCKSSMLFQSYAKFCIDRKKLANAQNIYIKALSAGFSDYENAALWCDFLSLMHTVNPNKELSVVDLYEAVKDQGVGNLAVPKEIKSSSESNSNIAHVFEQAQSVDAAESKENEEDVASRIDTPTPPAQDAAPVSSPAKPAPETEDTTSSPVKMEVDEPSETSATAVPTSTSSPPKAQVVREEESAPVERQYAAPDDLDEVAGLTPEQIIRIYSARPPMLFTALHKEPTSKGIAALTAENNPGVAELEAFLGCKLAALPTRTPNMHLQPPQFASWTKPDKYFDLIEGMWAAQALKERHFDSWITDMRNLHRDQEATLVESHADTHPSGTNKAAEGEKAALHKKQHAEVLRFRNHCAVQQELLHALVNKSLFTLLVEQQTQLATIGFPRFSTTFVDKLKLYIQNRKKSANNHNKTEIDANLVQQVTAQQEILCAFLSVRLDTVSVERARAAQLARPRMSRAASIDNDSELADPNYYDAEAKKLRKRRRIITQAHNDSYSRSGVSSYGNYDSPGMYMQVDSPGGYPSSNYAQSQSKPYYDDGYNESYSGNYPRARSQYHDPYHAPDAHSAHSTHAPRGGYPSYQQQSYSTQRYPDQRAEPRERGGLYATVSAGRGRGRGARQNQVQVQALGQGGPRQGSFATAAPQHKTPQTFDTPLQNTPNNPAVPLLQKLASLSNLAKKK